MKYKYRTSFTYRGKRYEVYANTVEELYEKKALKKKRLQDDVVVYDRHTTVDKWAEEAFDTYKANVQGLRDIKCRYNKYVSPAIGHKALGDVRAVECQNILNSCAGMSYSHCKSLKQEISFLFQTAVENRLIPFSPAIRLSLPEYTRGYRRSITDQERKHLLKIYEADPSYLLFMMILKCGCRPEEAIGLIGRDIDRKKRLLHIRGTKTKNSDRFVPIPADIYSVIKDTKPFEPVCPNRKGTKHSESSYKRLCAHLRRDMNISMGCKVYRNALVPPLPLAEDFVPYCLRHTYCTDLCKAGVDIRTAQRLMGHANISVTADIYTHVDMNDIEKAGKLIEQYAAAQKKSRTQSRI
ncbi:MAG: site-specific integrase [Lachnospiraceae bacterium]|nr:site-specific integrase [Lachnospiraceae bacterium]